MAYLISAVSTVIGPIGIRISYKTIADVDANGNGIAHEAYKNIGGRFEILQDSLSRGHMAGDWL
jgi:hypothetical protein